MKAVVAAFNQEKALVGAFSVITNLRMEFFGALVYCDHRSPTLNKLYIEMAKPVAVRFSLGASPGEQEHRLVRALPVYQDISRCKYFSRVE